MKNSLFEGVKGWESNGFKSAELLVLQVILDVLTVRPAAQNSNYNPIPRLASLCVCGSISVAVAASRCMLQASATALRRADGAMPSAEDLNW